jgi:enamine deaminase RidA (YjgF/YER057c/UK114 family)
MTYTANQMIAALAHAAWASRQALEPRHIIDQDGKLRVVRTVTPGDTVVVSGISAPRRTRAMIETETEAADELRRALPHIARAVQIVEARHPDIETDEVLADLMLSARISHDRTVEQMDRPSTFARLFGKRAFS